ncbi:MAG: Holliday junction resolvase RuvX [Planctomycetota bacterium]|jgi:putative Holliday junction resolvase
MPGRIIGVDTGDARTGVAVSDPLGITAQPREVVAEKDAARAAARVAGIARELDAAGIVVGLPVNMDGREGPRATKAREFGAMLQGLVEVPVTFWDERLTSMQAERALRGRGARQRKAKVDVVSAQIMLQSYLDAQKQERT